MKGVSAVVILGIAAVVATGCATMKDKTTTAKVTSRVVTAQMNEISHIKVKTKQGVVYLSGTVKTEEEKERLGKAASIQGHRVVNNLKVKPEGTASASPATK